MTAGGSFSTIINVTWSERKDDPVTSIEVRLVYGKRNTFFAEFAKNIISRGETFVRTATLLEPGTECTLVFVLPEMDYPFKVRGEVLSVKRGDNSLGAVTKNDSGMRMRLIYESDEEFEHFRDLVTGLMHETFGETLSNKLLSAN